MAVQLSNLGTQQQQNHVIDISKEAEDWITQQKLEDKITVTPKLVKNSAGNRSCCIFKVSQIFAQTNYKAYEPYIVSVGPYHHGKDHLKMIQEHKWRFLGAVLSRSNVDLKDFFKAIAPKEMEIRDCYSEHIEYNRHELIEMMVLDGCFIIELFCIVGRLVQSTQADDPIFSMGWVLAFLTQDLLRLENQIPFFVLESLYELIHVTITPKTNRSLTELALEFFDYSIQRPSEVLCRYRQLKGKHLLDLFRTTFIPEPPSFKYLLGSLHKRKEVDSSQFLESIQPALRLRLNGIKFKPREADSFLDIEFSNGVLKIPPLIVDDLTTSFLLNCVAYEQCYKHCSKHVTSYVVFMGLLINTPEDAGYLSDHRIIDNSFGSNDEVAKFLNDIGKDITFDIQRSYLTKVFEDVNRYYRNYLHVKWAEFKHIYFDSPWSFMSAMAALVLLILTIVQSFFAVYPYALPSKKPSD